MHTGWLRRLRHGLPPEVAKVEWGGAERRWRHFGFAGGGFEQAPMGIAEFEDFERLRFRVDEPQVSDAFTGVNVPFPAFMVTRLSLSGQKTANSCMRPDRTSSGQTE